VLIIPHKELFEVPWAALFDSQTGQYLIQRCVLRVAPSLRVTRTAADTLRGTNGAEEKGHALVVGNPLPTRAGSLPKAKIEAEFVAELLSGVGFEVHALMGQAATKTDLQNKIQGAKWAHLACHGAFGKKALMLAEEKDSSSSGKKHTPTPKKGRKKTVKVGAGKGRAGEEEEEEEEEESSEADLTMDEVQGSVRMGVRSTVVLSACNSGRGNIRAEGVVGLSRGFLFAGAAATVVSLWAVHDGSTAALMEQMYKHLEDGRTTAQALRLAMLHLLNGPAVSGRDSRWRRPLYWAAFLEVGANTRLPGVGGGVRDAIVPHD
jgi:CHAT domain-containing protein